MNKLLDRVDQGFQYFDYRLEELNTDDVYYIKAFIKYIQKLEIKKVKTIASNKKIKQIISVDIECFEEGKLTPYNLIERIQKQLTEIKINY